MFSACLHTIKKPDTILVLLEQLKPVVTQILSHNLLFKLFQNLMLLGSLNYDGLTKDQYPESARGKVIRESEEMLTLVVSWTTFLCSTVKNLNSKNSTIGLKYLAQQSEFAVILKQVLMLALDENREGEGEASTYSRCLAIMGK